MKLNPQAVAQVAAKMQADRAAREQERVNKQRATLSVADEIVRRNIADPAEQLNVYILGAVLAGKRILACDAALGAVGRMRLEASIIKAFKTRLRRHLPEAD